MKKIRCDACNGSKKMMGGGMIMQDCDVCDGKGFSQEADEQDIEALLSKKGKHYKKAKKNILALDPEMEEKQAEEILDKELKLIATEDME